MSGGPYAEAAAALEALWLARWPAPADVPVLFHDNTDEPVPSRIDTAAWLHVSIEFDEEQAVAFGSGYGLTERTLGGAVVLRVLAARGTGETAALALLDQALAVFRGQRVGPLSIIGAMPLQQPGASDDGAWWIRSAIAAFVYRFRG